MAQPGPEATPLPSSLGISWSPDPGEEVQGKAEIVAGQQAGLNSDSNLSPTEK